MISNTPQPPYYAVIFTSLMSENDEGYKAMAEQMVDLVAKQEGFLGLESVRDGLGITVSYWKDLDSIKKWKENADHQVARKNGREKWYSAFKVRITKVESDYGFNHMANNNN